MADNRSFAEIIVSKLGTPREPFGLEELLGLAVLATALAAYLALEYGLGRLIARQFARVRTGGRRGEKPPPDG